MTRRRRAVGWIVVLAALLVTPSIVGAEPTIAATAVTPTGSQGGPSRTSAAAGPSRTTAAGPPRSSAPAGGSTDAIVPGSVNRTSINLSAEYDVTLRVNFATRAFRVDSLMTITNTSGVDIDRLELNTIAARLGGMTITAASVAGRAVSPTTSDQTIHLPLGGILRAGDRVQARLIYRATLRGDVSGSDWMFTRVNGVIEAYRWLPWISQPIPFARPNHGDPFVTPVSPRVRVTVIADRLIRWATTGEQLTPIGTAQTFEARNVRDFSIVGAPDFRTRREPPAA